MNYKEACSVLGVVPSSNLDSIKKSYKKMVKFYHPDYFHGDDEKLKYAEAMTQKLNEAWECVQQNYENEQNNNHNTNGFFHETNFEAESSEVYTYDYPLYEPIFTKATLIVTIIILSLLTWMILEPVFDKWESGRENKEYVDSFSEEDQSLLELYKFTKCENGYSISPSHPELIEIAIIPESFNGLSVIGIDDAAFKNCTSLKEVNMPDTIIQIGNSAFEGCTSLSTIQFSGTLKEIGVSAFENCCSVQELVLPDSVAVIDQRAFKNCTNLVTVNIPASVLRISGWTFSGCSKLKTIHIPDSVEEVDVYAFENCIEVEEIIIDEGVKFANSVWPVFTGCRNVKKAVFPIEWLNKLSNIQVEEIVIINAAEDFHMVAFDSVIKVSILKDLEVINGYDFYFLESLREIHLPNSLKEIEKNAISLCPALSDIYYNGSLEQWRSVIIDDDAFSKGTIITIHCNDGTIEFNSN